MWYLYILLLIITLLIIAYVSGVNCVYVRECYRYSLTDSKSLL